MPKLHHFWLHSAAVHRALPHLRFMTWWSESIGASKRDRCPSPGTLGAPPQVGLLADDAPLARQLLRTARACVVTVWTGSDGSCRPSRAGASRPSGGTDGVPQVSPNSHELPTTARGVRRRTRRSSACVSLREPRAVDPPTYGVTWLRRSRSQRPGARPHSRPLLRRRPASSQAESLSGQASSLRTGRSWTAGHIHSPGHAGRAPVGRHACGS